MSGVGHHRALCQLEAQEPRGERARVQEADDVLDELYVLEVAGREVHGDRQVPPLVLPAVALRDGLPEHPTGEGLDEPSLLGVHPPGQVIVPGEPVGVLGGQLGLAHPAHPLKGLHHRLVPGQQPLPHRHQQPIPASEGRVAGRDVPHPRHAARQPRPRTP